MLVGLTEQVSPVVGETLVVSATVPVNPLTGMTVIMDVAATPGVVFTVVGFAVIVKSTTWTVIVAVVCERDPLIPVTVNPLTGATVIVTVAEAPALTVTLVVLAVMVKSVTF